MLGYYMPLLFVGDKSTKKYENGQIFFLKIQLKRKELSEIR